MKKTYQIHEKVWLYPGNTAWYFISISEEIAQDIEFHFSHNKRGWGSLPVRVTVGTTCWKTSIFPDKKSGTYLLPLKADVRKKEKIEQGSLVSLAIELSDEL